MYSAVPAAAGVMVLGTRADLWRLSGEPRFLVQTGLVAVTAVLATIAAIASSVPGAARLRLARLLPLLALGGLTMALVADLVGAGGTLALLASEPLHLACAAMILGLSAGPALIVWNAVRHGVPLEVAWAAGLAALAALGFGALGVGAVCPISRPAHLLVAHVLPVVVLTAAAAAAGRGLFRTARRRR
jgi:hypothetical protein